MKHTKGPWRVAGLNVGSASEKVVASCYKDGPDSVVVRPKTDKECLANAWLIAAAPDLLVVCRDALAVFQLQEAGQVPPFSIAEYCGLLGEVIKKAESRE